MNRFVAVAASALTLAAAAPALADLAPGAKAPDFQAQAYLAGKPFTLPDESRPYLVSLRSGLGKAGSQIDITDGWMLGRMRDDADGTSSLGLVQKLLGLRLGQAVETGAGGGHACMAAGLYRATLEGAPEAAHVALHPLLLY